MKFSDRLIEKSKGNNSVLVVGLDPNIDYFPNCILKQDKNNDIDNICNSIYEFNKLVIDAVENEIVAIKPQLAYYEIYGSKGIEALEKTIEYAKEKDIIIINDAKRGDIGPTAEAYAKALIGHSLISGDAVTVNPYLGSDGITPFLEKCNTDKGIFILVKTSNPSASDFQDILTSEGSKVYIKVSEYVNEIGNETIGKYGYSNIGAVVGATYPEEAKELREKLKHTLFLVPGFGVQGGDASLLTNFFDENGNGSVVSSSRDIIYAYTKKDDWKNISLSMMKEMIAVRAFESKELINKYR